MKRNVIGIIALIAIIGLSMTACGGGTTTICTEHDWDWTGNAIAATCTTPSKDTATCKNSGCTATDERDGSYPITHNWDWTAYTNDGIRQCQHSACTVTAGLGDTGPAGGIIFYVEPAGFKLYQGTNNTLAEDTFETVYYLEAWTANETEALRWSYANEPEPVQANRTMVDVPLVQQAHDTSNPTQWIGHGLRNTRLIINAMNAMVAPNNQDSLRADRAVHMASAPKGGFNDWFLPSIDELKAMYAAHVNNVTGLPTDGFFFTSSQYDSTQVSGMTFFNGQTQEGTKWPVLYVRAVRAF